MAVAVSVGLFGFLRRRERDWLSDALRVRSADVRTADGRLRGEPLYSFLVALENTSARPIALVGVRRLLLPAGDGSFVADSTMSTALVIEPGESTTLGAEEAAALSRLTGVHYLVLAVRYGDPENYRTNRGELFVLRWPGAEAGWAPPDLEVPTEEETARVRQRAFARGGWWGTTGPEQRLPEGWAPRRLPVNGDGTAATAR